MGQIPTKALRESELNIPDKTIGEGAHDTFRVTVKETGRKGFYKKLDPKKHYPELLAKISVAASLFKRTFQGKRSAEECLVFDENNKIVGTLSFDVEGFEPLNYKIEPIPSETDKKKRVIPDTKTLIEKNMIELLFGRWLFDDDDVHPHNLSLEGDIDFDMFFYWFTIWMKEPRATIGVPKTRINLTVRDWEGFPIVKDSLPFHWPTYNQPGQETFPTAVHSAIAAPWLEKTYADPAQFAKLAGNKEAKEQQLAVAMKALLTYQPEVMRQRLTELFGDLTLNYTSLEEVSVDLRMLYEEKFPELCNDKTNTMSFVDFMMNLYQKHYDNLYRVVVFYMGCEDNGYGVSMPSTCNALYKTPSLFRNVEAWVKEQNGTLYGKDEDIKFDATELQKRYHQIWRDSFTPTLNELLHNCYQLSNKLLFRYSQQVEVAEVEGKKATDDSLTNAWEMIGSMPELSRDKIEPLILVDKGSSPREGLLLLVEFTKKLHAVSKIYYEKARADLTEEDNLTFVRELKLLHETYNLPIRQKLLHESLQASEFNRIACVLNQFTEQVNFAQHLTTTDEQMKDTVLPIVAKKILPHTHEDIIKQYNDYLFQWAKGIDPKDLERYINEIIDKHYSPYLSYLTKRHRAQPVKDYLKASALERGDNRLSYIFSTGSEDTGALNKLLIQHLTEHMLQSYPLPSVSNARKTGAFEKDLAIYTQATVNFAKYDKRFNHLYCAEGVKLLYKTFYEWAEKLDKEVFGAIIGSALSEYESKLWLATSRRKEVEEYMGTFSNKAKILAFIFLKGEKTSTFSTTLFQKLIARMKFDIGAQDPEIQQLPGNKLIMQYNPEVHTAIYDAIKIFSEGPSNKQDKPTSSSSTQRESEERTSSLTH